MAFSLRVETLLEGLDFPEGPVFDDLGRLWLTELKSGNLCCWQPGGNLTRYAIGGNLNGLVLDNHGYAWFTNSLEGYIGRFNLNSHQAEPVLRAVDGQELIRPNDLIFDGLGNLLFSVHADSRTEPIGYVACLRPDGSAKKIAEGLYFPNGLGFWDEGQTLVLAETYRQRLWQGTWNAKSAEWTTPVILAEVGGKPGPDGMALGADGYMYVAVYGAGQIKAIEPDGRIAAIYDLPGLNPTNCAFDPSGKLGLVVTEAERGLLLSLPGLGPGAGKL